MHHSTVITIYLLAVSVAVSPALSSFLIGCNHLVSNVRVDPIINFGTVAGHDHTFFGSNGISAFTKTGNDLIKETTCHTCSGNDKSAYWVPTLMWRHANGTLVRAKVLNMVVYWDNTIRGTDRFVPIIPMPLGLKLLEGSVVAVTASMAAKRFDWSCSETLAQGRKTWPVKQCDQFMRLAIRLPDCWNGKDLYLPGSAHMAHSTDGDSKCPPGFKRTWALRYEIDYEIKKHWRWDVSAGTKPRLVLGRPEFSSSYGAHADFFNGLSVAEQMRKLASCGNKLPDFCLQPGKASCRARHVFPNMSSRDIMLQAPRLQARPLTNATALSRTALQPMVQKP
eukprot:jgi/Chrzof1/2401/Cz11g14020.t1